MFPRAGPRGHGEVGEDFLHLIIYLEAGHESSRLPDCCLPDYRTTHLSSADVLNARSRIICPCPAFGETKFRA
jgi:hypothetical protein